MAIEGLSHEELWPTHNHRGGVRAWRMPFRVDFDSFEEFEAAVSLAAWQLGADLKRQGRRDTFCLQMVFPEEHRVIFANEGDWVVMQPEKFEENADLMIYVVPAEQFDDRFVKIERDA